MASNKTTPTAASPAVAKRTRLSQEDVPGYSLAQAVRVPIAIGDGNGFKPTRPIDVAALMKMAPKSGGFRGMCGAAIAYGLTQGGPNAPQISLTPLGLRVVRPTKEGDDQAARREAVLRPKVIRDFLGNYDKSPLPAEAIAKNVLLEMGVPTNRLTDVYGLIVESAEGVGFLKEINGRKYVDLAGTASGMRAEDEYGEDDEHRRTHVPPDSIAESQSITPLRPAVSVGPGVHINIEIHIAADASADTIQEIFKGMRRYVLNDGTGEHS